MSDTEKFEHRVREEDDDLTLLCEHCNEPLREHPCVEEAELSRLVSVDHHMAACRELLKVPDHEVLYEAIKELMKMKGKQ